MRNNNALVIVPGSLGAIASKNGGSIAESFVSADAIIICDTSGSMAGRDSRDGQSRYDVACQELQKLQATMPGKLAVIAFSDSVIFCPGGVPEYIGSGTNLAGALKFAKVADVPGMRFIVISDGQPDDEQAAIKIAATFAGRIDCIFVGPESDFMGGREFLAKLARAHKGKSVTAKCAEQLAEKTTTLLLATA